MKRTLILSFIQSKMLGYSINNNYIIDFYTIIISVYNCPLFIGLSELSSLFFYLGPTAGQKLSLCQLALSPASFVRSRSFSAHISQGFSLHGLLLK